MIILVATSKWQWRSKGRPQRREKPLTCGQGEVSHLSRIASFRPALPSESSNFSPDVMCVRRKATLMSPSELFIRSLIAFSGTPMSYTVTPKVRGFMPKDSIKSCCAGNTGFEKLRKMGRRVLLSLLEDCCSWRSASRGAPASSDIVVHMSCHYRYDGICFCSTAFC